MRPQRTAEVYTPATNTWTPVEPMQAHHSTLVLLDDGRVFAVGGYSSTAAEIFDPATGHWTTTPEPGIALEAASVAKLADGRVLVAGGDDPPVYWATSTYATAAIYDPALNTWTAAAPMHTARGGAFAGRLPDGRVLVAGGFNALRARSRAPRTRSATRPSTRGPSRLGCPGSMARAHA